MTDCILPGANRSGIRGKEKVNNISIAGTTREERERIVAESIGNISGLCDGCSPGIIEMYQDYIDGKREISEINRTYMEQYRQNRLIR